MQRPIATRSPTSKHDEIGVFVRVLPDIKPHTTEAEIQDLVNKLNNGYLDKEIHEKAKTMDAQLTI